MNTLELTAIYTNSPIARAIFDNLSGLLVDPSVNTLTYYADTVVGKRIGIQDRRDVVRVFRALETAGAGRLIEGGLKRPTEFEWTGSPVLLARLVTEERSAEG